MQKYKKEVDLMFKKKSQKVITIDGMNCNHCTKKVETALANLNNVSKVKVNLKKSQAIITFNKEIDNNIITKTITDLGYHVTDISE